MDQNFQTSFIPKKPMIEERATVARPISFLTITSIFIFFTVLIASGGLYFYNNILSKNIAQMQNDLGLAKKRFEPEVINNIQTLDKRMRASTEILSKHVTISPIFKTLQDITMKNVSYTKFAYDFSSEAKDSKVKIKMSGIADSYMTIALQSDIFAENKNLISPVFSNLTLDDKSQINFDLDFSVDLDFIDYKKTIEATNEDTSAVLPDNGISN